MAWEDITGLIQQPLPRAGDWLWANIQALSASTTEDPDAPDDPESGVATTNQRKQWAPDLEQFARANADHLALDTSLGIKVEGFHPTLHFGEDRTPTVAFVVQYTQGAGQADIEGLDDVADQLRRGTTIISDVHGIVRHIITKPLPRANAPATEAAFARQRTAECATYLTDRAYRNPQTAFSKESTAGLQIGFAAVHGGRP